jgi:hypothetical protein
VSLCHNLKGIRKGDVERDEGMEGGKRRGM